MRTQTMSDKAYNLIKEQLIYAEKGSCLSVRQYAGELGMSYTPVREAFLRLHKEGLLELVPNVGFFCTRINIKEILEIFQVRECIEPFVLRKVFNLITDGHIQMLEKYYKDQKHGLASGDIREYVNADEMFHKVFLDIYDNQQMSKIIKNVREQHLICSNKIAVMRSEDAVNEHKELIQYIKNKDLESAVSTLTLHIENAKQRMKDGYIRVID